MEAAFGAVRGRQAEGLRGHLINLGQSMPDDNLPGTAADYLDPVTHDLQHQWRRDYSQDAVDNIKQITDTSRPNGTDQLQTSVNQFPLGGTNPDARNLIGYRSDTAHPFAYDQLGRLNDDPTTHSSRTSTTTAARSQQWWPAMERRVR